VPKAARRLSALCITKTLKIFANVGPVQCMINFLAHQIPQSTRGLFILI
jgi:hypothetical protein